MFAVTCSFKLFDVTIWKSNDQSRYLGQLVPELIQVAEDLGMDSRAPDVVNIPQNAQNPPPENKGRISMPASQTATSDDADVISQKLAAVCKQDRSEDRSLRTTWKPRFLAAFLRNNSAAHNANKMKEGPLRVFKRTIFHLVLYTPTFFQPDLGLLHPTFLWLPLLIIYILLFSKNKKKRRIKTFAQDSQWKWKCHNVKHACWYCCRKTISYRV